MEIDSSLIQPEENPKVDFLDLNDLKPIKQNKLILFENSGSLREQTREFGDFVNSRSDLKAED